MGDSIPAPRPRPTQFHCLLEMVGTIQQYSVMALTGQAHILQHVEQTNSAVHETLAEVKQLKAMFKELLEMLEAECNKQMDEACSPIPSNKEVRRRSPDTDSRGGAVKASRGGLFPELPDPQESVEQPESPKSPMIMLADLKQMIADEGPSSPNSPLSKISSIMKNSPGGQKLLAEWVKVLEIEQSHDATYYYKE